MDLNPDDLDELLGAYALDALDPDDRALVERLRAATPEVAARLGELEAVTGLLGADETLPPPAGLRQRVQRAARAARRPGRTLANPLGPDLAPHLVFERQADDLRALLSRLASPSSPAWDATTSYDRPVRDLLAHLAAVLEVFAAELGVGAFDVPDALAWDHWGMTEPVIAALAPHPDRILAALADVDARLRARLATLTARELEEVPEGGVLRLADRIRAQVFELWMHCDDTRRAVGLPLADPDPERLAALCDLAARAAPVGMALTGRSHPGLSARLVLLGAGGGTWIVPLGGGPEATDEAVTIVAAATDFCRVAGKLLAVEDVHLVVEGDAQLAADVLAGVRAFAV